MLATASEAFRRAGPEVIASLIQALHEFPQPPFNRPAFATGRTAQALAYEATDDSLTVTGPPHIQALITGRGPSRNGPGGTPLHTILEQWAQAKPGFALRPGQTYRQVGFALAHRIHREGTALYRGGRPSGIIQSVLTKEWLALLTARIAAGEQVAIASALTHAIQGK